MKRALVLSGGAMRGAYEVGALKALEEMDVKVDLITAVSIGALNATLYLQSGTDALIKLWNKMDGSLIFKEKIPALGDLDSFLQDADAILPLMINYVRDKKIDNEPFQKLLKEVFDESAFHNNSVEIGFIMLEIPRRRPFIITKEMMKGEEALVFLTGTASCFPAFPMLKYKEKLYIDGGYYDNLPIDLALQMGADEVIAIDLTVKPTNPQFAGKEKIKYIKPRHSLGPMFDFNKEKAKKNMRLGYLETMKSYEKYDGLKYTFIKVDLTSLPSKFYFELLQLDHRCKKTWKIVDDLLIYNKLKKENECDTLSEKDIHFAMLEQVMKWKRKSPYELYDFESEVKEILDYCKDAFEKEYAMVPTLGLKEMIDTFQQMNRMELLKKIIHQEYYPEKEIIPVKVLETVLSLETAVARWIIDQQEMGEEKCKK